MRNHWLKLHEVREFKRKCEVVIFERQYDATGGDLWVARKPFKEAVTFRLKEDRIINGFFIVYEGRVILRYDFLNPMIVKSGESIDLDLSRIRFSY